ncbi:Gfo/Idh/MocA family protein [Geomicrobium sp. JCM 19039]|uniref:Gfo/Idh/MocA family protein n=1 Tax=Geomicrobium sp. JCM 19039 TaxID=1460636 RepID=UPI00045F44EA|nr:Gfo/Idh/MocA family oxidoreductase [Geomicrobium sp. JCM 19039]GAK12276.1 putative oxidoreductase [Geomicrobium sp. JCM 19039]
MVEIKEVSILLVGIGGYGSTYVRELLSMDQFSLVKGVVDPNPERSPFYAEVKKGSIPVFETVDEFFANHSADLTIISSPIPYHNEQTLAALKHDSHVLCEKPLTTDIEQIYDIIALKNEKKRFVAVGFDWSYSRSIQKLKAEVISGTFGRPIQFKTLVLWPRDDNYFQRAVWAGKCKTDDGIPIYDSVANNAAAHFLHNMFYLLGSTPFESAHPLKLESELYRVNPIETFDTCALRVKVEGGTELLYLATHAGAEQKGPIYEYVFEDAVIQYERYGSIIVTMRDGTIRRYSDPEEERSQKLFSCIEAVKTKDYTHVLCGPESVIPHVMCIDALHTAMNDTIVFPDQSVIREDKRRSVKGLDEIMKKSFELWKLPSELEEADWAVRGYTSIFSH